MKKYLSATYVLAAENLLIKGWELSLLLLLPFLQLSGQITLGELGLLSTIFAVTQLLSSLASGYTNLHFGILSTIKFSFAVSLLAWILLLFQPGIAGMIVVYILGGLSAGLFETSGISHVAKSLEHGKRANGIANMGMAGDSGRILFTALTSFFTGLGFLKTFFAINILLSLIILILQSVLLKDLFKNNEPVNTKLQPKAAKLVKYFQSKTFVMAFIAGCLDSFSSASLYIFLPLLFESKGYKLEETGLLSLLLFVGYLTGRKVLGKFADKYGTGKTLIIGEIFMAAIIFLILLTSNFVLLIILMVLLGVAARGTSPVVKALIADSVPDHLALENGVAIFQSGSRLNNALSRSVFTVITDLWGINWVFILSALTATFVAIPIINMRKRETPL